MSELKDISDSELKEELKRRNAARSKWPKKVVMYLHGDEESNRSKGEDIGLSDEAIDEQFRGALYEVEFTLSVNKDGTYTIVKTREM